jgi:hypothetical protein
MSYRADKKSDTFYKIRDGGVDIGNVWQRKNEDTWNAEHISSGELREGLKSHSHATDAVRLMAALEVAIDAARRFDAGSLR